MNDSQNAYNASAHYNTFKVSLNKDQQKALHLLLPNTFSFQPYKMTRSLDEESADNKTFKPKKAQSIAIKDEKDPDYSAPYAPRLVKEPPTPKVESLIGIPGGQQFMQCYLILKKLRKTMFCWPFKFPVDPKALKIPQYINVVQEPMDMKTMQENIKKQVYKNPSQFHRDMYKMLMNSYKFNQKNSQVFATTIQFEEEYLKLVKDAKEGKLKMPEKKLSSQQDDAMSEPMIAEGCTSMEVQRQVSLPQLSHITYKHGRPRKDKSQKCQKHDKHDKHEKREKYEKIEKNEKVQKHEKPERPEKIEKQQKHQKYEKIQKPEKTVIYQKSQKFVKSEKFEKIHEKIPGKIDKPEKVAEVKPIESIIIHKQPQNVVVKIEVEESQPFRAKEEQIKKYFIDPYVNLGESEPSPPHIKQMVVETYKPPPKPAILKEARHQAKQQLDDPQYSIDQGYLKKSKSKNAFDKKNKLKKQHSKKPQYFENPNEMKELKENTQAENEKNQINSTIQKKLTQLLKKYNDFILPNRGRGTRQRTSQRHEHPNFTNFTTVTAAQKKKLIEKIGNLNEQDLRYVIEICYRNKRLKSRDDEGVYEIDLDKLDGKILKQLSNFVGLRNKKLKREMSKNKEELKAFSDRDRGSENIQNQSFEVEDQIEQISERNESEDFNRRSPFSNNLIDPDDVRQFPNPYANDELSVNFQMIDSDLDIDHNDNSNDFPF